MTLTLPARDGVSANRLFLPAGDWATILAFLAVRFPEISEAGWRSRMARGLVLDEQGQLMAVDSAYCAGSRLYYYRELERELEVPFEEQVLYEDEHILIADKPHFLPTLPSGRYLRETLVVRLRHKLGLEQLVPLHRLDRETAGLVMLSKNVQSRDAYHRLFREHRLEKTYEAIAPFCAEICFPVTCRSRIGQAQEFYRRQEVPGEPNAISHIDLIERRGDRARYRLQPVTGKTHQLRIHMASLGLAILNDPYYPERQDWRTDEFARPLQLLAKTLAFSDPCTGEARCFSSQRTLLL